jgi:hypothetical protein
VQSRVRRHLFWVGLLALSACDGPSYTVHVEATGSGVARVRSEPPGLDCRLPCEAEFPAGSRVTVTIDPGYGSRMIRWADLCGDGPQCDVMVTDGDVTLAVELDRVNDPVLLSETDRDPRITLRDDHLAASFYEGGAVRSDRALDPGSGVFYYEAHRLAEASGLYGFGVASERAPIEGSFEIGGTDQSFGVAGDGTMYSAGMWVGRVEGNPEHIGFVVDYRGASPTVYVLAADGVRHTQALAITEPLFIYLIGQRRSMEHEVEINPGNDIVNAPFTIDVDSVLRDGGHADVADELELGWGSSWAGEPDEAPVIEVPGDRSVRAGSLVTLDATAMDIEDGDLTDRIEWELLSSPHYAGRIRGTGPRFTFTADAVGIHPARARVRDDAGHVVEGIVHVRVDGPVARAVPGLALDDHSGDGVEISSDGMSARWTGDGKNGVRATQSLYGEFWYFEIERLVGPANQGGGLVIGAGNLGPYSWADVPASMSINTSDGVYRNLIWHSNFPSAVESYESYGFAVDYRGEHPIVYVIAGGEVIDELLLDDVWVEIYPMIYGNPTGGSGFDERVHLSAPFAYDPRAALAAHGVDESALVVGWGH